MDVAASAIIDMLHSSSQTLHIVHPNPSSWSTTMRTIGSVLNLPLVPFSEWVSKLEASANSLDQQGGGAASLRSNPSLALLDFYKHMGRAFEDAPKEFDVEGKEAGGIARLSTDKSTGESESLKNAPTITEQDAKRWIGYWRAKGFLKA